MFTKTIQLMEFCVTIFISAGNKLIKETMKTAQLTYNPRRFYIDAIIDTREIEEVENQYGKTVFKPIPGTGDDCKCEICGKAHEVIVYVRDRETSKLISCGKTCAKHLGATNSTWDTAFSKSPKFAKKLAEFVAAKQIPFGVGA